MPVVRPLFEPVKDYEAVEEDKAMLNRKYPFDILLMKYIFLTETITEVRNRAVDILIQYFNQRQALLKELVRTEIIVSKDDYMIYFNFLSKQRLMKQLINKLVQDEMFHMVYKKSPSMETKNTKKDIINILS